MAVLEEGRQGKAAWPEMGPGRDSPVSPHGLDTWGGMRVLAGKVQWGLLKEKGAVATLREGMSPAQTSLRRISCSSLGSGKIVTLNCPVRFAIMLVNKTVVL